MNGRSHALREGAAMSNSHTLQSARLQLLYGTRAALASRVFSRPIAPIDDVQLIVAAAPKRTLGERPRWKLGADFDYSFPQPELRAGAHPASSVSRRAPRPMAIRQASATNPILGKVENFVRIPESLSAPSRRTARASSLPPRTRQRGCGTRKRAQWSRSSAAITAKSIAPRSRRTARAL